MRPAQSRATTVARGGALLMGAQGLVLVSQFGYSSVTARLLPAADFGAFAVALSLMGLLSLLLATGLPSYVMQIHQTEPGDVWGIRCLAWVAGLAGALALVLGADAWASVMHSPAVAPVTRALALQLLIAPASGVELALLRREGRRVWDAAIPVVAAVTGALVGLVAVSVRGSAVSLVVSPVVASFLILVGAIIARRERHPRARPANLMRAYSFSRRVSTQNLGFLLMSTSPTWVMSGATNAQLVGQFSRASLVTGVPSTALSTAMTRTLQPEWRHVQATRARAMVDSCVMAAGVALPLFAVLSALASPLILLWLGPGWETAAAMTRVLAIAFGLQVVFTVLANAAEMQGMFRPVRKTQLVMAACLLPGLLQLTVTGSIPLLLWAVVLSQLMGIVSLAHFLDAEARGVFSLLMPRLFLTIAFSAAVWAAATLGGHLAASDDAGGQSILGLLGQLGAGCGVALSLLLLTLRWQPAWTLARRKGILPGFGANWRRTL